MRRTRALVYGLLIATVVASSCRRETDDVFVREARRLQREAAAPRSKIISESSAGTSGLVTEVVWRLETTLPEADVRAWYAGLQVAGYQRLGNAADARFVRDAGGDSYYLSVAISTSNTIRTVTYAFKSLPN
jgi:hypothetical protein